MQVEDFIHRWTAREGGAERANYQMFLSEFCDVIGVPRPEPSGAEREHNDYVFERAVRRRASDEIASSKRIDLYKKGCFILEAKQSRLPGAKNAIPGQGALFADEPEQLGKRSVARGWDVMMQNARKQAEEYVYLLDASHPAPPFVIACDVGNAFEVFADFTGTGRAYSQFPDRKGFRVYLDDLRNKETREFFARIWTDPASLDPAKESARVTREIAKRLAEVSKALEKNHPAEEVAHFLMRCIFTMFAEDVDLLPKGSFTELLEDCVKSPSAFVPLIEELWAKMDEPEQKKRFFSAFRAELRYFNGNLFKNARAFPLGREEIGELLQAAKAKWTEVDPAIFGTLLEQALEPGERKKLGAHYTPRSYVQRLVEVTVMEPLRGDWQKALTKAEAAKDEHDDAKAIEIVRGFHHQLCLTRVLDPACGTGNFLYVSLELMKKLEGEVLETLARLGFNESLGLERETVDPHQFLGLELNPRAAAIAELVVWIGYLQQHYRTRTGHPAEPILQAFKNINFGHREGYDAVLTWDGYPVPKVVEKDGRRIETYPNARRPDWPKAEFIVGNPPFIKGSEMRSELGDQYAQTIWRVYDHISGGADFVMFWWDQAATEIAADRTIRRFGFVTTNKIAQGYSRDVVAYHLSAKRPVAIIWAIDDHPWYRRSGGAAQVRISMTVVESIRQTGRLLSVIREADLASDQPEIVVSKKVGLINPDLTTGVDIAKSRSLLANAGCCFDGVKLHGRGFIIDRKQAHHLGLGVRPGLERHIRPYKNGMDLKMTRPERMVIDMWGLDEKDIRSAYPEVYQHLMAVRAERQAVIDNKRAKGGEPSKDLLTYLENWWLFGKPRPELRPALSNLKRYIGTIDTARHRVFQFINSEIVCDDKVVIVTDDDASILAMLSSRIHVTWANRAGGWLGVGNDPVYVKTQGVEFFANLAEL
ncbi:DNA methyltransferase [Mesorhizobium sp. M0276]|uniref:class I SAM-dependent DNA methyltransferase n=1 Tax=Mesorhizobium sp. M0276 TaxID=2956928 RepID=UPI00333ACFC1